MVIVRCNDSFEIRRCEYDDIGEHFCLNMISDLESSHDERRLLFRFNVHRKSFTDERAFDISGTAIPHFQITRNKIYATKEYTYIIHVIGAERSAQRRIEIKKKQTLLYCTLYILYIRCARTRAHTHIYYTYYVYIMYYVVGDDDSNNEW